jgi:hypothetical protein
VIGGYANPSDYAEDKNHWYNCTKPTAQGNCFWPSPQNDSTYSQAVHGITSTYISQGNCSPQPIDTLRGGCARSNGSEQNSCGNNNCSTTIYDLREQSCKNDRNGTFQCGGATGCGINNVCGNNYVTTKTWGTNLGAANWANRSTQLGFNTTSSGLVNLNKSSYTLEELSSTYYAATAQEACHVTGEKSNIYGDNILCRCGQYDVCGDSTSSADRDERPANLKVTSLYLEEYIGPHDGTDKYANPLINTPSKHRLVVSLDVVDKSAYTTVNMSITDRDLAKQLLYTRLIEVCPINLRNFSGDWNDVSNWRVAPGDNCVIRRVDGNLANIQAPFYIPLPRPVITKSTTSEGPWTVRFRAINDVCNRTFADNLPDFTLAGRTCNTAGGAYGTTTGNCLCSGDKCITTTVNDGQSLCHTGKFTGITSRGNAPAGAYASGTNSSISYCSVAAVPSNSTGLPSDPISQNNLPDGYAQDLVNPVLTTGKTSIQPTPTVGGAVGGYPGVDHTFDNQNIGKILSDP